jgi:hypothetical protein
MVSGLLAPLLISAAIGKTRINKLLLSKYVDVVIQTLLPFFDIFVFSGLHTYLKT